MMLKRLMICLMVMAFALPVTQLRAADDKVAVIKIAVVDVQQLMNDSKAAKSIQSQGKALRAKYQERLSKIESDLKASEKKVMEISKEGDKDKFIASRKEFQKELMDSQKELAQLNQKLDKAVAGALNVLQDEIIKIVDKLTIDRNYDLVMTRAEVITVSKNIDITAEVMETLNKKLTTVQVRE